jgi:predicted nucleic acid-binding Zn ribbon protein
VRRWRDLERVEARLPGRPRGAHDAEDLAEVAATWESAVGPAVAAHTTPARLRRGELLVHCESAVWAGELTLLQRQVLSALASALGERAPARLRFEVGELPAAAPVPRRAPPARREVGPEESRRAAEIAAAAADPALRGGIERALRAAMRAGRLPR